MILKEVTKTMTSSDCTEIIFIITKQGRMMTQKSKITTKNFTATQKIRTVDISTACHTIDR
jgi:hypothetical protein